MNSMNNADATRRMVTAYLFKPGFRLVWVTCFVIAVLGAPFIVVFKERYPLVMTVPLVAGAILLFILEFIRSGVLRGNACVQQDRNKSKLGVPARSSALSGSFEVGWLLAITLAGATCVVLSFVVQGKGSELIFQLGVTIAAVGVVELLTRYLFESWTAARVLLKSSAGIALFTREQKMLVFDSMHALAHITRDALVASARREASPEKVVGALSAVCDAYAATLSSLFENKLSFRVAVKAYDSGDHVVTVARDAVSLKFDETRPHRDTRKPVIDNTPFYELLSTQRPVFASDELTNLAEYKNTSADWARRYTATMVVPIRKALAGSPEEFELLGYIAVSCRPSRQAKIFCDELGEPDEALTNYLLAFADSTYSIIKAGRSADRNALSRIFESSAAIDELSVVYVRKLHAAFAARRWPQIRLVTGD